MPPAPRPPLPGLLAEIAEVIGEAAALRLVQAAGGTELYLSPRPQSRLAGIVGPELAAKLCKDWRASETIVVPMASLRGQGGRRAAAARLLRAGATASQTALACDMHERTARRIRSRTGAGPLFGED